MLLPYRLRLALLLAGLAALGARAQSVGIGTPTPSAGAALEIASPANNSGLLIPRLSAAQRAAIAAPPQGLLVYQTDGTAAGGPQTGFWYFAGSPAAWTFFSPTGVGDNLGNHLATQPLSLQANALTGTGASIGTAVGLGIRADGGLNMGQNTAGNDLFIGYQAGQVSVPINSYQGVGNQFIGYQSGAATTTGSYNLFEGGLSGLVNTNGYFDVFLGYQAGTANTLGAGNVFSGYGSGYSNTTGDNNVFTGFHSGYTNTTGSHNTALGASSGPSIPTLTNATAIGYQAQVSQNNSLVLGGTGGDAVSVGIGITAPLATLDVLRGTASFGTAAFRGTDRISHFNYATSEDTYIRGGKATSNVLLNDKGGNVGIGLASPRATLDVLRGTAPLGTAIFRGTNRISHFNYAVNEDTYIRGGKPTSNVLLNDDGGNVGIGTATPQATLEVLRGTAPFGTAVFRGTARITYFNYGTLEATYIRGGKATSNVLINDNGGNVGIGTASPAYLLDVAGTIRCTGFLNTSDARFKQHVRPLAGALAGVRALRPVRYDWNALGQQHGGTAGTEQVGLLAQEVEQVYPELVSTDAQGYKAVNYAQLTPVLIGAIKELAARNASLETRNATLETYVAADHASLLTLQAQMARLLGEAAPASAQARK